MPELHPNKMTLVVLQAEAVSLCLMHAQCLLEKCCKYNKPKVLSISYLG